VRHHGASQAPDGQLVAIDLGEEGGCDAHATGLGVQGACLFEVAAKPAEDLRDGCRKQQFPDPPPGGDAFVSRADRH
jgi:hypothetical protein